jgi:quercetin dioxygenase-like cupin family protein
MVRHFPWSEVEKEHLNPLLERQFVNAGGLTVSHFLLRKGCLVPEHHHANEQITNVLTGALKFGIEGREIVVRGGESIYIPPNVPHWALAEEDTRVFDVFTPAREDWQSKTDAYLRKGAAK